MPHYLSKDNLLSKKSLKKRQYTNQLSNFITGPSVRNRKEIKYLLSAPALASIKNIEVVVILEDKLGQSNDSQSQTELFDSIVDFVSDADGLKIDWASDLELAIQQTTDGKTIPLKVAELQDVLVREDSTGSSFIQVNFLSGAKILITDTLIGFKPHPTVGLDLRKLPKVVTTPDLLSVFEATEEAISAEAERSEVETLKKVFQAILIGGEAIGFELDQEREWFNRLTSFVASA